MPHLSSYYVALHTGQDYSEPEYETAAGQLVALLTTLLSSRETIADLTDVSPTSVTTEIEAVLEGSPRELVAKAVIDILCPEKAKFNKAKFSALVKASQEASLWPAMKIAKKLVPAD